MPQSPDDWTDATPHDPGVTLLEALAYAVADLSYGVRRRLARPACGWRCLVGLTALVAGAILLHQSAPKHGRRSER